LNILAWRLQRAEGPDRGLDWEIHCRRGPDGIGAYGAHPAYTASLDAALTLVPPHHLWEVKQGIEARAIVWRLETDYDDTGAPTGYSTTFPAIALCVACIRAEADMQPRREHEHGCAETMPGHAWGMCTCGADRIHR
jgi:hypothetical protein